VRFWQRRRVVQAVWLTLFAIMVGVGLALCGEAGIWARAIGTASALTGAAGLLLFFLAGPGGW
jgi:hypothetical protein